MQLNWRFKSLRKSCNLTALNVLERPNRMMSRRKLLQNGTCRASEFARIHQASLERQEADDPHADPRVAQANTIVSENRAHIQPVQARAERAIPDNRMTSDAWYEQFSDEKFNGLIHESDNASHFKSKEYLYYWTQIITKVKDLLKIVWVDFGCPGHGKGPWDGLGAMAKTKLTRDMTNGTIRSASGRIESIIDVAQHLRATFGTQDWISQHQDMQINQVVVMYLSEEEIGATRPKSPPDVSPAHGISSCYSFMFLGTVGRYCMRHWRCWCASCSRVRGVGHGCHVSRFCELTVPACERSNLTTWHQKQFTVRDRAGIQERRNRAEHSVQEALKGAKPGNWGCVQVREGWSTEELPHYRPGHFWIFEFGEASQGSSVEKEFHLQGRRSEVYKGTRFTHGDKCLIVKRYLHRVPEDEAGLLFEEWQPQQDVDASIPEEPMIINSSELRAAGFKMTEVIPPALEQAARRGGAGRRKGAGLRRVGGLPQRFTLSVADDNKFRALCE